MHTRFLEISDIAGHDNKLMNERRCGDQCIAFRSWVWNVKSRAAAGDSDINRQGPGRKFGHDLIVKPSAQSGTLLRIAPFNAQDPLLQFEDRDRG